MEKDSEVDVVDGKQVANTKKVLKEDASTIHKNVSGKVIKSLQKLL